MDAWISLAVQVPLVGIFIWYSLTVSKSQAEAQAKFMDALDRRDLAFEKRNQSVISAIDALNASICAQLNVVGARLAEHDAAVEDRFSRAAEILSTHDARAVGIDAKVTSLAQQPKAPRVTK